MAELPELPAEPAECRQRAETLARTGDPEATTRAVAWALLAIAGELATIRRELKRSK